MKVRHYENWRTDRNGPHKSESRIHALVRKYGPFWREISSEQLGRFSQEPTLLRSPFLFLYTTCIFTRILFVSERK